MRDGPLRIGQPERGESRQAGERGEGVLRAFGEAEAGIEDDALAAMPAATRGRRPLAELARDFAATSSYDACAYMSDDRPRLCIRTTAAPAPRDDAGERRIVGQRADVVDDRRRRASIARSATSAL